MRQWGGITDSVDVSLSKLRETTEDSVSCSPRGHKEPNTT